LYIIRKYKTNRKLYDLQQSKYVNLTDIEKLIQNNNDVSVVDSDGDDLTGETMLAIIANKKENTNDIIALENIIRKGHSLLTNVYIPDLDIDTIG
jgi:polyhydroxyalkanoate synthesis regulator protein